MIVRFWRAQYGGMLLRELVLLAVMLHLYRYVRFLVRDRADVAFHNAHRVLEWERLAGLNFEAALQRAVLPHHDIITFLNRYYVTVHFAGTVAFLIWAFVRSHRDYRMVRRVLVTVTLAALAIHVAFPLAPPRMMPGFVDTMLRFGPNPYDSAAVSSFANQYAAMPSLHVGWALIVAYGVVRIGRHPGRWLVMLHPTLTIVAVILTANHYWLDGAVAAVLVALAARWLYRPEPATEAARARWASMEPMEPSVS